MSTAAFRRFVTQIYVACEGYLAETDSILADPRHSLPVTPKAKKSTSVKGNPRCKCGHGYSVHDEPRDDADGRAENICRGCEADGVKLGCPEFISKRGGAIVTTAKPGMPPKDFIGMRDANGSFQPVHLAILAALKANSHQGWTAQQISILAVYVQSGTFNSAIADLRDLVLIEGSPELQITTEGERLVTDRVDRAYDAASLRAAWSQKQGKLGAKIIEVLHKHAPVRSAPDLATRCGYAESGTFNSMVAKMRRMGLIEVKLPLRLCAELS